MDDNSLQPRGLDGYDRLGKLRPLISHFTHTFTDLYEPNKELTVDEAMIKFTGQSLLKQYNANEARETWHQRVGASR